MIRKHDWGAMIRKLLLVQLTVLLSADTYVRRRRWQVAEECASPAITKELIRIAASGCNCRGAQDFCRSLLAVSW